MQETHAERAYRAIRQKLETGELAPGAQLVNRTLAREIGTSPIPVREAIYRLACEGLVIHVSGAGAFVHRPDLQEMLDLYGLREAVEKYAVEEALRSITAPELAALRQICVAHRRIADELARSKRACGTLDEVNRWMDCEERFHSLLIASSRNRLIIKTERNLRLIARVFERFRRVRGSLTPEEAIRTCLEHEGIVDALERSDAAEANRLIAVQMAATRADLLRHFAETG